MDFYEGPAANVLAISSVVEDTPEDPARSRARAI
jgi:hypothetical protein